MVFYMKIVNQIFNIYGAENKVKIYSTLMLVSMASFFEAIGIGSLYPLIQVLRGNLEPENYLPGYVVEIIGYQSLELAAILAFILLMIFSIFIRGYSMHVLLKHSYDLERQLSLRIYRYICDTPLVDLRAFGVNKIQTILLTDVERLTGFFLVPFLRTFAAVTTLISLLIVSFIVAPKITTLSVLVFFIFYTISLMLIRHNLSKLGKSRDSANQKRHMATRGIFKNIKYLKANKLESYFSVDLTQAILSYTRSQARAQELAQFPRYVLEALLFCGLGGALVIYSLKNQDQEIFLTKMLTLGLISYRVIPALQVIFGQYSHIKFAVPIVESVCTILNSSKNSSEDKFKTNQSKVLIKLELEKVITIPANRKLIKDIDPFYIVPGDCVGVMGKSGSGKTSFIDNILGLTANKSTGLRAFFEKERCEVFDSNNAHYVTQETLIFSGSLKDNICVKRQPNSKKEFEILKFVLDGIPDLNLESHTWQDTNFNIENLSGGQRQRVALARAVLSDKLVIVLDEATSSLDLKADVEITKKFTTYMNDRIIFLISHRSGVSELCNSVIYLSENYIRVAKGNNVIKKTLDEVGNVNE